MELTKDARGSPVMKSESVHSEPVIAPVAYVHELIPAEGHMINPMTGEQNIFLISRAIMSFFKFSSSFSSNYILQITLSRSAGPSSSSGFSLE